MVGHTAIIGEGGAHHPWQDCHRVQGPFREEATMAGDSGGQPCTGIRDSAPPLSAEALDLTDNNSLHKEEV